MASNQVKSASLLLVFWNIFINLLAILLSVPDSGTGSSGMFTISSIVVSTNRKLKRIGREAYERASGSFLHVNVIHEYRKRTVVQINVDVKLHVRKPFIEHGFMHPCTNLCRLTRQARAIIRYNNAQAKAKRSTS